MRIKKAVSFAAFLLLVFLIEWIGHKMTFPSVQTWYTTLQKPLFTPPSWLFGPVWTLLYASIAIGGWLIWIKVPPTKQKKRALFVYTGQLIANLLWSYCFFFLQNPFLGLLDIGLLLILIGATIVLFWRLYPPAGWILVPYFLWTLYASFLNIFIWKLNS